MNYFARGARKDFVRYTNHYATVGHGSFRVTFFSFSDCMTDYREKSDSEKAISTTRGRRGEDTYANGLRVCLEGRLSPTNKSHVQIFIMSITRNYITPMGDYRFVVAGWDDICLFLPSSSTLCTMAGDGGKVRARHAHVHIVFFSISRP